MLTRACSEESLHLLFLVGNFGAEESGSWREPLSLEGSPLSGAGVYGEQGLQLLSDAAEASLLSLP